MGALGLPRTMVCRQCILPQRLTHFSGALFVSADSLFFHPSPEGLPTFLVCLREIFFFQSLPPPYFNRKLGDGGQLHLQSSTCLTLLSSDQTVAGSPTQFTRPWVRGLQGAPAGRNCLPVTKVLPLEKMPKNCQVTDSPREFVAYTDQAGVWWLCLVNGSPRWPEAEAWGASSN